MTRIARILTRHGLGFLAADLGLGWLLPFHRDWLGHAPRSTPYARAEHLRLALEELGPTYVKLGQILSTRPDLMPRDVAAQLTLLQEHVPPVAWSGIEARLEQELGARLGHAFAYIDTTPLAAASIAQVHAAELRSGERVVLKVQRPGALRLVDLDLQVLHRLARIAGRRSELQGYDLVELVDQFGRTIRDELDFTLELRSLSRFAANARTEAGVLTPRPYPELSTGTVLTLERIDGLRIDDARTHHLPAAQGPAVARRLARLLFRSALVHGLFHADPHPGNFRITAAGELAVLDFGMMGYLTTRQREQFLELVLAVVDKDAERVTERLMDLGARVDPARRRALDGDVARLLYDYLDLPLGQLPVGELLSRLLDATRQHRLVLPGYLAAFAKTVLMAEGIGVALDPDFRLAPVVRPLVQRALLQRLAPARVNAAGRAGLLDSLALVESAPRTLRRWLTQADHERSRDAPHTPTRRSRCGRALGALLLSAAWLAIVLPWVAPAPERARAALLMLLAYLPLAGLALLTGCGERGS